MNKSAILDAINLRIKLSVQGEGATKLLTHFFKYHLARAHGHYVTHPKNWELVSMAWECQIGVKLSRYISDGYTMMAGSKLCPDDRIPERSPTDKPMFYRTRRR